MTPFEKLLLNISETPIYVVKTGSTYDNYVPLDLTESNTIFNQFDINDTIAFENYVNDLLAPKDSQVAFGGYLEKRALYKRSDNFNTSNPNTERNIHLGVDFWCKGFTPVLAALEGKIHSFNNNTALGDYGPTIILEHKINETVFYTLYGHLNNECLIGLKEGDFVTKGQEIAKVGIAPDNGDYAPHLHFQVINDMLGKKGDFKGVTSKDELPVDRLNCPDPNILPKINNLLT